jgi:hypothetical protein
MQKREECRTEGKKLDKRRDERVWGDLAVDEDVYEGGEVENSGLGESEEETEAAMRGHGQLGKRAERCRRGKDEMGAEEAAARQGEKGIRSCWWISKMWWMSGGLGGCAGSGRARAEHSLSQTFTNEQRWFRAEAKAVPTAQLKMLMTTFRIELPPWASCKQFKAVLRWFCLLFRGNSRSKRKRDAVCGSRRVWFALDISRLPFDRSNCFRASNFSSKVDVVAMFASNDEQSTLSGGIMDDGSPQVAGNTSLVLCRVKTTQSLPGQR